LFMLTGWWCPAAGLWYKVGRPLPLGCLPFFASTVLATFCLLNADRKRPTPGQRPQQQSPCIFAEIFHRCMVCVSMREKVSVWAAHHHHLIPLRWPCCATLKSNFCCCSFSAAPFSFFSFFFGWSKRVYHEFGYQVVLREYSEREDSFERLKTRGLPIQNSLYRSARFFLSIHFFCFLFSFVLFQLRALLALPSFLWNEMCNWGELYWHHVYCAEIQTSFQNF